MDSLTAPLSTGARAPAAEVATTARATSSGARRTKIETVSVFHRIPERAPLAQQVLSCTEREALLIIAAIRSCVLVRRASLKTQVSLS